MNRSICCAWIMAMCQLVAGEADGRSAKALWSEAAKANEVWTCLQLEAWATERKPVVRLPGQILGGSKVLGSIEHGFPSWIKRIEDRGDQIGVFTGDGRFHLLADDGQPIALPVRFEGDPHATAWSHDRRTLAVLHQEKGTPPALSSFRVRVDGPAGFAATVKGLAGERTEDWMLIAPDGGALLIESHLPAAPGRLQLWTAAGMSPLAGCHGPVAIGPPGKDGRIVVAHRERVLVAIDGKGPRPVRAAAMGPGAMALLDEARVLSLHLQTGMVRPLSLDVGIGDGATLRTVGGWLLLEPGSGVKRPGFDALGDPVAAVDQPAQVIGWRWSELLAGRDAPQARWPGTATVCADRPASIWRWHGGAVLRTVLGDEAIDQPFATFPKEVGLVDTSHQRVFVYGDGWAAVADLEGRIIHSGEKTSGPHYSERSTAWYAQGAGPETVWTIVHLPEPGEQQVPPVRLQLPEGMSPDAINIYSRRSDGIASIRGAERFAVVDLRTGKVLRQGPAGDPNDPTDGMPRWDGEWDGRFLGGGNRVVPKTLGWNGAGAERWRPIDLARSDRGVSVLCEDGRVWTADRKGQFSETGRTWGDRFVLVGDDPAVARGDAVTATIRANGLSQQQGVPFVELPAGPWRLREDGMFVPPRAGSMRWDAAKAGFEPRRLRSIDGVGMAVMTGSVVILLDPDAVRRVASPQ